MIKCFFDMEFSGLHQHTKPISIGVISESGDTFYAEFAYWKTGLVERDFAWIMENVVPHLTLQDQELNLAKRPKTEDGKLCWTIFGEDLPVASLLQLWLKRVAGKDKIQMWSDCLAYDWVLFNQLFGHAFDLPEEVHYIPLDLCTLLNSCGIDPDVNREEFARLEGEQPKHNALHDAKVIKLCYDRLAPYLSCDLTDLRKFGDAEQLQVQLAGCSVAALGGTNPENVAKQGDYGWSPSYQDVLNLRRNYDRERKRNDALVGGGRRSVDRKKLLGAVYDTTIGVVRRLIHEVALPSINEDAVAAKANILIQEALVGLIIPYTEPDTRPFEELKEEYIAWRFAVDQDHIIDDFDLALGWFAGKGLNHDEALRAAEFMRDEQDWSKEEDDE